MFRVLTNLLLNQQTFLLITKPIDYILSCHAKYLAINNIPGRAETQRLNIHASALITEAL
jgi:hypothetical protein